MGGCGPRSSEPKAHAQASQTPMFKRTPALYGTWGKKRGKTMLEGQISIYIQHPFFCNQLPWLNRKKVASLHLKFVILGGAGNKRSGVWLNSSAKAWIWGGWTQIRGLFTSQVSTAVYCICDCSPAWKFMDSLVILCGVLLFEGGSSYEVLTIRQSERIRK